MALAPVSSPASPHAEDAIVLEVKDEEAEDREELPTIKTPAMASILGECLTEVLQDMGASVSAEEEELLLQNFHKAWSKEMSKLPRMWEVDVTLGHCFRGSARSRLGAFRVSPFGWFGSAAWAPLSCKTRGQQCSAAGAVVRQAVNITSLLQKLSP
ncbi:unnamed protein product [Symbiodinium necroappetens]|uniref:Uncharacterized protein n=1 Tax=Symbiodinium necroappetens TaxID=1628268 RepID=A0A813A8P9_9DINO|nr:unnamed protein product [Symbiodinium necroappetens]